VVGVSGDLIERYLAELRARLHTPGAVLVLAEAEDHLRETAAAGLAIGMSEREAQEAAISAFGSVRAFVAEAPGGTRYPVSNCLYWMKDNPGAHTCARASMLEGSGDIVVLGAVGAIFGTLLLEGYFIVRYVQRKRGIQTPDVLPRFAFPAVAVAGFGGLAVWLAAHAALRAANGGGPGSLLSGAIACAAVAAWYVPRLRRGLATEEPVIEGVGGYAAVPGRRSGVRW
jgi:hypothetical protein